MRNLLYIVALILVIGWAVGFFVFHTGPIIHTLLVIVAVVVLIQIIRGRRAI